MLLFPLFDNVDVYVRQKGEVNDKFVLKTHSVVWNEKHKCKQFTDPLFKTAPQIKNSAFNTV